MKSIAFFGHRPVFNYYLVKERLENTLKEVLRQDFARLLIGCHGDFDSLALSASVNYKKNFNNNIKINEDKNILY